MPLLSVWTCFGTAVIAAACLWVYRPVFSGEWELLEVWDDDHNLVNNERIRKLSWRNVAWILQDGMLLGVYEPVTTLVRMLQYATIGVDAQLHRLVNVVLHALVTICMYCGTVALHGWVSPRQAVRSPALVHTVSVLAALAYALHPMRVEVVMWASCLPYILCALFCIAAAVCCCKEAHELGPSRNTWHALTMVFFVLSVASKAAALGMPIVFVCCFAYWDAQRARAARVGSSAAAPLSANALAQDALRSLRVWARAVIAHADNIALSAAWVLLIMYRNRNTSSDSLHRPVPGLHGRLARGILSISHYALDTVVPAEPLGVYMHKWEGYAMLDPPVFASLLLWAGMGLAAVTMLWRHPGRCAGAVAVLGCLLPCVGVVQHGRLVNRATRYTYLCSIFALSLLALAVLRVLAPRSGAGDRRATAEQAASDAQAASAQPSAAVSALASTKSRRAAKPASGAKPATAAAAAAAAGASVMPDTPSTAGAAAVTSTGRRLLALAMLPLVALYLHREATLTTLTSELWRSELTLFNHTLQHDPDNLDALVLLGNGYSNRRVLDKAWELLGRAATMFPSLAIPLSAQGETLVRAGKPAEALPYFDEALQREPEHPLSHLNRARVLEMLGRADEAAAMYQSALTQRDDSKSHHSVALNNLGSYLMRQQRYRQALDVYLRALEMDPDYAISHYHTGNAYKDLGELELARQCYMRAVDLDEKVVGAHANLGVVLLRMRRTSEAVESFRKSLALRSSEADYTNLALGLMSAGKVQEATRVAEAALLKFPDSARPKTVAGMVYFEGRQLGKARKLFEAALKLTPNDVDALLGLGSIHEANNKLGEAAKLWRRTLAVEPNHPGALARMREWERLVAMGGKV